MTEHDETLAAPKSCGLPAEATKNSESGDWIAVGSFFPPPSPEPAFEDIIDAEVARWSETARDAGLVPEKHVRVDRGDEEITVMVSPRLDAIFTPEQTLWRAV